MNPVVFGTTRAGDLFNNMKGIDSSVNQVIVSNKYIEVGLGYQVEEDISAVCDAYNNAIFLFIDVECLQHQKMVEFLENRRENIDILALLKWPDTEETILRRYDNLKTYIELIDLHGHEDDETGFERVLSAIETSDVLYRHLQQQQIEEPSPSYDNMECDLDLMQMGAFLSESKKRAESMDEESRSAFALQQIQSIIGMLDTSSNLE
ncbi:hypothetical protein PCE1_004905 [Barthelona sp. PCE]